MTALPFKKLTLVEFCCIKEDYPYLLEKAVKMLPFLTPYLCEAEFSSCTFNQNEALRQCRSRCEIPLSPTEANVRVC